MFKAKLIPEDHCKACRGRHICIHADRSVRVNCPHYNPRPRRIPNDMIDAIMKRSLYEAVEGNQDEEP